MTDVLDIQPMIRRRKVAACEHLHCTVDTEAAFLVCDDCETEIDPWWFIRRLANDEELLHRHHGKLHAAIAKTERAYHELVAKLNADLARQNDEIRVLVETKNRLWNERAPDGLPLGGALARRRRRKA